jgi:hypothetical protein
MQSNSKQQTRVLRVMDIYARVSTEIDKRKNKEK